jgi:hypothetical protein
MVMIVLTTRRSRAQLRKEEREKQKQIDQDKGIIRFLFCTQDTLEGVSDLGLIAVL